MVNTHTTFLGARVGTKNIYIFVILLSIFCSKAVIAADTLSIEQTQKINQLLEAYQAQEKFSGSVEVKIGNDVVYKKSLGLAVREHSISVNDKTVFGIGSLSKQFTAAAVMYLHQQGKLTVTSPISSYLEVPESWSEIKIFQFLSHTSGIGGNFTFEDWTEFSRIRLVPALFKIATEQFKEIAPERIGKYEYSNVGYSVAAMLIEEVTGKAYSTYMNEVFFPAAGLLDTAVDHSTAIVANRATAYEFASGKWMAACCLDLTNWAGSGDMRSTTSDLIKWSELLEKDTFLFEETKEKLFLPRIEFPERKMSYASGWIIDEYQGKQRIWHNGKLRGFQGELVKIPSEKFTLSLLVNQGNVPTEKIKTDILNLIFEVHK